MSQTIALVGGSPRSGTSALGRMLSAHPDVAIMHERFTTRARSKELCPSLFETARAREYREGDGSRAAFDIGSTRNALEKWEKAKVVGDKIPNLPVLLDAADGIAGCKVIAIMREPFGMAQSFQARFDAPRISWSLDYRDAVKMFNKSVAALSKVVEGERSFDLMVLNYDSAFNDPDVPQELFRFLGVDPDIVAGAQKIQADMGSQRATNAKLGAHVSQHVDFDTYRPLRDVTLQPLPARRNKSGLAALRGRLMSAASAAPRRIPFLQ